MIVKGASRSGPTQLGNYLMRLYARADKEELVELIELQSPWADAPNGSRERNAAKLVETFRDWQTLVEGTKQGRDGLYHAQISPEARYTGDITPKDWKRMADILAEELGLQDQPRAIVLHGGKERPHLHIVWQRTDVDRMKLVSDAQNYMAHEKASLRMEKEFKHDIVPGKHAKRDRKKQPEFPRQKMNHEEAQQAERLGMSKDERIAQLAALRRPCDNGLAFKTALEEAGYILARGDRRGLVLVDQDGESYSLSRHVKDLTGKQFKAFMAPVDPATLPSVAEAEAQQEQRQRAEKDRKEDAAKAETPAPDVSKFLPDAAPQTQPAAPVEDPALTAIKKALAERQAKETQKWAEFHAQELRQLEFDLDTRNKDKLAERDARDLEQMQALKDEIRERNTGLKGFINAVENRWNPQLGAEKAKERRREIAALKRRQQKEREDYAALLEQTRQLEIDNLKEGQSLKRADVNRQHEEEKERYIREHEEAKRILAETKAEEQRQELEHNDSLRDGPPPPKLGK